MPHHQMNTTELAGSLYHFEFDPFLALARRAKKGSPFRIWFAFLNLIRLFEFQFDSD